MGKAERPPHSLGSEDDDLQGLVWLAVDWLWEQNAQFRFTRFNGRNIESSDTSSDAFIGKRRWEIGLEILDEAGWSGHRALLEARRSFRDLVMCRSLPDGNKRYISVSGMPVFDEDGRYVGYRGIGRDVTSGYEARMVRPPPLRIPPLRIPPLRIGGRWINDAILRARSPEELYQGICSAAVRTGTFVTVAFMVPDPGSGRMSLMAVNSTRELPSREACIWVNTTTPEGGGLVGAARRTRDICVSDGFLADEDGGVWRSLGQAGEVKACGALPLVLDGHGFGVLLLYTSEKQAFDDVTITRLRQLAQNIAFALNNFARDAERVRVEKALRANEEKYRTILESVEDAYYEVDLSGNVAVVNPAFSRMLGYAESELKGLNNRQFMRPEVAAKVGRTFKRVYRTGTPMKAFVWEMVHRNGRRILAEASIHLIKDTGGRPVGFRGMLRNVTERKREERLLALEHAISRALAEDDSRREVLEGVLHLICETEQWESAGYFSIEDATGAARLVIDWSVRDTGRPVTKYYLARIFHQ
jgi:PAS domain S-box-containing protein